MALGFEVALVFRAKSGVNFLLQTQGISAKDANEATKEAMSVLTHYVEVGGTADLDRSGDDAPGFSAGQLLVCSGRLRVVYRLVNSIWVMTVTPAVANVLLCIQVLDTATHLLFAAAKGLDVTPDKLARRYPEVYMAAGQILSAGGLCLDAGRLLAAAEAEVAGIAPETGAKPKGPTASLKSRLGVGPRKPLASSASAASLQSASADVSVSGNRPLSEAGEYIGATSFVLQAEALTPQFMQVDVEPRAIDPAANQPLDDPFAPPIPVAGAEILAGTGLETLEAPAADYSRFTNLRPPPPPPPASVNPWADAAAGLPLDTSKAAPDIFQADPTPSSKPAAPQPTPKQQRAIANGNALQLVEVWKAIFHGARLEGAGIFGEVLGTGAVPRCSTEVAFQLQVPDEGSRVVQACANAAQGEPGLTGTAEDGVILARLAEAPRGEGPFLTYQLPAVAIQPPILLAVAVAERPKQPTEHSTSVAAAGPADLEGNAGPSLNADGLPSPATAEVVRVPGSERDSSEQLAPDEDQGSARSSPAAALPQSDASTAHPPQGSTSPADQADTTLRQQAHSQGSRSRGRAHEQQEVASPTQEQQKCEYMLVVTAAVRPDLPGPLRGVCIDLDVHFSFGEVVAVHPGAQFSPQERRLRWRLFDLQPGSKTRMHAVCKAEVPLPSGLGEASNTLASLHAFGPPGIGLSGISLLSGTPQGERKESRAAFHCEVYARPKAAKKRVEYTKQELLEMAVQILERQKRKESNEQNTLSSY